MADRFVSDGSDVIPLSLCGVCKHKTKGKSFCSAFKNGIPSKFLLGKAHHTNPEQNDNGIQFESNSTVDPETINRIIKRL